MIKENVVIGQIIVEPHHLFAENKKDWETNEKEKTLFTNERFLPKIMVQCGIVKNISEVRRNQKSLCITLDKIDFITIKWGKKFIFIAVGE